MKYVDPTGEIIENSSGERALTDKELERIAADLRKKTGLSSITFKNGKLTYDKNEVARGGSAELRNAIIGAINDTKNIFQLANFTGSVQFMQSDAGEFNARTGVVTYQIKIDFGDYKDAANYSDSDALEAFSLGSGIYHEITHKVSYDPNNPLPFTLENGTTHYTRPDLADPFDSNYPGVIDLENVANRQLGLPIRESTHTATPYTGIDPRFKGTQQIKFKDAAGRDKFVRWKLESKR